MLTGKTLYESFSLLDEHIVNFSIIKIVKDIEGSNAHKRHTAISALFNGINKIKTGNIIHPASNGMGNENYDVILKTKNNKIHEGFKSVYVLSNILRGKDNISVRRIKNVSFIVEPYQFNNMNMPDSVNVILKMLNIYDIVSPHINKNIPFVGGILNIIANIVLDVKKGELYINRYETSIIRLVKKLVEFNSNTINTTKNNI